MSRKAPSIVALAKWFATKAHQGQFRKYTGTDYFQHLQEVVDLLRENVPHATQEMLAAAYLHDLVEDTHFTVDIVAKFFGPEVGRLVRELTDTERLSDGNRAERHRLKIFRMSFLSPAAQTIKYADMLSNCASIIVHDPKFAQLYCSECFDILQAIPDGDPKLKAELQDILRLWVEKLNPDTAEA